MDRADLFTPAHRAELRDLVATRSFRTGHFTLASGRTSSLYFNLKPTMMHPRGAELAARGLLALALERAANFVSGLEMGAVPAIGALAAVGSTLGFPVATCFVRKAAKAHGTAELIEGLGPGESLAGAAVLVIDDVATTGGSTLQAVEAIRAAGGVVDHAAAIVDREEGADTLLASQGVTLHALLTADDFATGS